jgi:hypothetical protein
MPGYIKAALHKGIFPVVSSKGNKYIMILYDYDINAILAQPIKDRTAPELLRAFQVMEQELVACGLKPKLKTGIYNTGHCSF